MTVSRFGAVALLALAGLVFGNTAYSFGGDEGGYTIFIKMVKVKDTQKDGSSWDVDNGKPDIFVRVSVDAKDSKAYDTKVVDDVYEAKYNEELSKVRFNPGQKLMIQVLDKDVALNDTIGNINVNTNEKNVKGGVIRLESFGQVIALEIEFRKVGKDTSSDK